MNRRSALKTLIVTFAALTFGATTSQATSYPPLPASVEDYLKTSHIAVIGRIGRVIKSHTFYGYQENAAERERLDPLTPLQLGFPVVDYEIVIEEVLMDDGYLAKRHGEPLVLRVLQGHTVEEVAAAYAANRGRFIFFLSRNPDDVTYGTYSPAHKISLETGKPSYLFDGRRWPILPDVSTGEAFVGEVRQAITK